MNAAAQERLKAYGFLGAFVALVVIYGYMSADTIRQATTPIFRGTPLLIGALVVSLATVGPMVMAFRASTVDNLVTAMRHKAQRTNKKVTFQTASRTASFYVAALASTPALYGLVLLFLVGEFRLLVLLLPAVVILATVGWFVLGNFFKELRTRFIT